MFDSEIFKEFNLNDDINDGKNKISDEHTFDVELPQNINNNEHRVDSVPKKDIKRKRKVPTITEPPKKPKTKEVKKVSSNVFRKEKYTTTVKNWLESVVVTANNNNTDIDSPEYDNAVNSSNEKPSKEDSKKNNFENITISNVKSNKKTIQSQLANKDGIMKFKKPKAVDEVKLNENFIEETDVETKTKSSKNVTKSIKDKKVPKFVAPIKSQLPVRDMEFVINIINESNIKDYRNKLDMIKDSEVVTVLNYRLDYYNLFNLIK